MGGGLAAAAQVGHSEHSNSKCYEQALRRPRRSAILVSIAVVSMRLSMPSCSNKVITLT
jgi:hypothetical protein